MTKVTNTKYIINEDCGNCIHYDEWCDVTGIHNKCTLDNNMYFMPIGCNLREEVDYNEE